MDNDLLCCYKCKVALKRCESQTFPLVHLKCPECGRVQTLHKTKIENYETWEAYQTNLALTDEILPYNRKKL